MALVSVASAKTVTVTPTTIVAAFAAANAGDTLRLVGTFGQVNLADRSFSRVVTLDASRALFNDSLGLTNDANVAVYRGTFDVSGGSYLDRAVVVYGSDNISFTQPSVIGNPSQRGIDLANTTNATVTNGHFQALHSAIGFDQVSGGTITGNKIVGSTGDGIDIFGSHSVTASHNSCVAGSPGPGVHPDCIQLASTLGEPIQSDNVVTLNTASGATQGFTSFGYGGGGLRLTITHNTVNSSYPQGIACYDCVDSDISYNTVATLAGAAHLTNIHIIGGRDNTTVGNVIRPRTITGTAVAYDPTTDASGLNDGGDSYVAMVPEPTTWAMLLTGFATIGLVRRRAAPRLVSVAA